MRRAFNCFYTLVTAATLLVLSCCAASAEILFDAEYFRTSGLREEGVQTIHSISYVDNTFVAYLDDESLRTYDMDGSLLLYCQLPEVSLNPYIQPTINELQGIVTNIATDGTVLYGWNVYSGQFGVIDSNGIKWNDVCLQIEHLHPYGSVEAYRIGASYVRNSTLFVFASLTEYSGKTEYCFYAYDLLSGQEKIFTIPDVVGVCPGDNDQFFFLCKNETTWSINMLSTSTGDVVPYSLDMSAFPIDDSICGLAYDQEEKKIYFACEGTVYSETAEGLPLGIGSVNTNGCMSESSAWILSNGRYALCSMIGLNIVNVGSSEKDQSRLVVLGTGLTKANACFQVTYPNTALTYMCEDISANDLAVRLLTQDDSIDIYKLQVDSTYTSIKEKGLFAPLSSSIVLQQECHVISADILDVITDEKGVLVAYPASLSINTFGINMAYWNMVFGDRPIPRTIEELLDAWILFEDYYADEYPLLDMWYGFDEELLCRKLLADYLQSHVESIEKLAIDPSLRLVLEKLSQIGELREAHQRTLVEWTPEESDGRATIFSLFAEREAMYQNPTYYLETQENMVYGVSMFNYSPISLSWADEANQPNASLTVYVINPHSNNIQEAINYIESAAQMEVNPYLYYAIHPTLLEPYENPSFQLKIDILLEDMKYIEELLLREDVVYADRLDLEAMLEYEKHIVQEQEQLKWMITAKTIKEDRVLLSQVNLNQNNVYLTAMKSSSDIAQLCSRYIGENLSLDIFLKQLGIRLDMITMEIR